MRRRCLVAAGFGEGTGKSGRSKSLWTNNPRSGRRIGLKTQGVRFPSFVDLRLIPLALDVDLPQVLLQRDRLDGQDHGRLAGLQIEMLVPCSNGNVNRIPRRPVKALLVNQRVPLASQNMEDRFVVLVG